ncbi:hypothetical protein D8B26_002778 [Coccidioides posadasii str. Silveira]|uniref:uncharacterized protein n=1 Tax=Coccidioides posadasii (strain RMSCC 757 / Silveira) TaxID=443226 RepID=UPI001BED4FC1|nr:hypothetical protein D8B26_002778 [Coccidioides posadasii str. Silveira]
MLAMHSRAALLIGDITHCRKEWELLSSLVTLKEYPSGTREEFMRNCKNGAYDDVVAIYRSNVSTKVGRPRRWFQMIRRTHTIPSGPR